MAAAKKLLRGKFIETPPTLCELNGEKRWYIRTQDWKTKVDDIVFYRPGENGGWKVISKTWPMDFYFYVWKTVFKYPEGRTHPEWYKCVDFLCYTGALEANMCSREAELAWMMYTLEGKRDQS
jgi:hypothetical protein